MKHRRTSTVDHEPYSNRETDLVKPTLVGRFLDEKGHAIKGVRVVINGTTTGTFTDENGTCQLAANDEKGMLSFSHIGSETKQAEFAF